jgi:cell division septum initiation protein DivIVA
MSDREPDRVREYVDTLQKQVTHLKAAMDLARKETSEQVRTRIQQVKADMAAQESASEPAGQATGRAQSPWQSIRANAAAGARDMHDRMGRKRDELDAKSAEQDAEGAEEDALDALSFARWAVGQAEVAVLDAIDARGWADERAAARQKS